MSLQVTSNSPRASSALTISVHLDDSPFVWILVCSCDGPTISFEHGLRFLQRTAYHPHTTSRTFRTQSVVSCASNFGLLQHFRSSASSAVKMLRDPCHDFSHSRHANNLSTSRTQSLDLERHPSSQLSRHVQISRGEHAARPSLKGEHLV